MIKVYENQFRNNLSYQYSKTEKNIKGNPKLLLDHYLNKNINSFVQNKGIKDEYNIFRLNNNYSKRINISEFNIKYNSQSAKGNPNKKFINRISSILERNYPMENNIYVNTANLKKNFLLKEKMRINNNKFLPKVGIDSKLKRNIKDHSFKVKNNKKKNEQLKDKQKYLNLRNYSFETPKIRNFQKSSEDVKNALQKELILSPYAPKCKFKKISTALNLSSNLDIEEKKSPKYEENGGNKVIKPFENQDLLYSQIFKNFIKVNKNSESQSQQNQQKYEEKNFINKKKTEKEKKNSSKFTIKDHLNNFDPQKYIKKLKDKQINIDSEDLNEIKNEELRNSTEYIEYLIFKKDKSQKKKINFFKKIKEKNGQLIIKYKNEFLQTLKKEILLKTLIKDKKIICVIYMDILYVASDITFKTYIKLNLMKHVLTKSKNENLYFYNMINHILYSGENKNYFVKYGFKMLNKFIKNSNKKIYYRFFSIKFQQYDSETILNNNDENKKVLPKNETKDKARKKGENSENRKMKLKIGRLSRRSTIFSKFKNFSSSKLINFNTTKNIIKLRETNLDDNHKKKNSTSEKLINVKIRQNNNSMKEDINESSKSNEYNHYINSYRNNHINNNNKISGSKDQIIIEDNEEIHHRDRKLLFEKFFTYVQFCDYDNLYNWLKKSGKYMDLNCKFDNGDTLLHLCVRFFVPLYLIKFLIINGININEQNNDGDTALHIAAKNHKYKMIDLLIKLGASEDIYNNQLKNCWECL